MKQLEINSAYSELQNILREKVLLVVGTGASMALNPRFGMGALGDELLEKVGTLVKGKGEADESNALICNEAYKCPLKVNRAAWKIERFFREVLGE